MYAMKLVRRLLRVIISYTGWNTLIESSRLRDDVEGIQRNIRKLRTDIQINVMIILYNKIWLSLVFFNVVPTQILNNRNE